MSKLKSMTNEDLVKEIESYGIVKSVLVRQALRAIDRVNFVLSEFREYAYVDHPLPIGFNQTISQPFTVAFMLDLLDVRPGEKILEIGAGSGWQASLLAFMAGQTGKVVAIERIPELASMAKQNIAKYDYIKRGRVQVLSRDGFLGFEEAAPYDKIISAAAAEQLPEAWKRQLKVGGRLMTPVRDVLYMVDKLGEDEFHITKYPGFYFVPLVQD